MSETSTALDLNTLREMPKAAQEVATTPAGMGHNRDPDYDIDFFHATNERDNALVADEVLNGALSSKFAYSFPVSGKTVSGISVIGARHLMYFYGGIHHRIVSSMEKEGEVYMLTTYASKDGRAEMFVKNFPELANKPNFYTVVIEITDTKKGNVLQVEKTEFPVGHDKDGKEYKMPHFRTIAQSKAFRNGLVSMLPQDVVQKFLAECSRLGNTMDVTESVIDAKRSSIKRWCEENNLAVDPVAILKLTTPQASALDETFKSGGVRAFKSALQRMGLVTGTVVTATKTETSPTKTEGEKPAVEGEKKKPAKKEAPKEDTKPAATKTEPEKTAEPDATDPRFTAPDTDDSEMSLD